MATTIITAAAGRPRRNRLGCRRPGAQRAVQKDRRTGVLPNPRQSLGDSRDDRRRAARAEHGQFALELVVWGVK